MTPPIPSVEPANFAAGETVKWNKSVADYPSTDGWSLIYSIRGPTALTDVTATSNSDGSYSIVVGSDVTGPLTSGRYLWASHAYKTGTPPERYPIARGVIIVTPNLVTATTIETHARKMVRIIEAEIEARINGTGSAFKNYTIETRHMEKFTLDELYALRSKYRAEVARENVPNRANPKRSITFVNSK